MKLKKLHELRAECEAEMQLMLTTADTEERALTDEESTKFDELEKKISDIDRTIKAEERARSLAMPEEPEPTKDAVPEQRADAEEKAFADYIRGVVSEERAELNMAAAAEGANGSVTIPTTIANKIIERVYDLCPIYQLADKVTAGGNITIPYYDAESDGIQMDYADEFKALTSTSGKFTSINLSGFLSGVLTKISKSLVNNSQFDIVNYVIDKMADAIAKWIEKQLLIGKDGKIEGISKAKQKVEVQETITPDDLIDLQETIPDVYQPGAVWIMNKATRTLIRKFKDKDDDYLLNKDLTSQWGYTLLGKPVYCTDQLPKLADANEEKVPLIVYGDMKGLIVKTAEGMNIEVLREHFAVEHAIGVVGWLEMDAKIQNEQMIAVLKKQAGE